MTHQCNDLRPGLTTTQKRGFSLVEVLVAMAMLGSVMIAIMSLFFFGRRNVYSGKQMTNAVAVGNRILEDLAPLDKQSIYNGLFAVTDTSTGYASAMSLGSPAVSYANCRIRSTDATIGQPTATDVSTEATGLNPPLILSKWRNQLGSNLANGSVTLIMTPTNDATSTPPQFKTATIMQIRILIQWVEMRRNRQLILDTAKTF